MGTCPEIVVRPAVLDFSYDIACRGTLADAMNITKCNQEGDGSLPYTIPEMVVIAILAGTLSLVTVLGNSMVMISFKIDRQLQTISNYFLFSLAVADLAIGLISMPLFTVSTLLGYWPLGRHICDTWLALDYLASNASVLNLLIISFDRYFSVTRPLTYRAKRTTGKAAIMIAGAWGISLLLWPPWIYAWPYIEGKRTVPERECYIQFIETNHYITFGTAIAAFYIPVSVMIVLYYRIWRETKKRQKDLPNLLAGSKDRRIATSRDGLEISLDDLRRIGLQSGTFGDVPPFEREFRKKHRCLSWGWIRNWCLRWWHSGRVEEYDIEERLSEMATTPMSMDPSMQQNVSRTTSFTVIQEHSRPSTSTSREPIVTHPEVHWPPSTSRPGATSRSTSTTRTPPGPSTTTPTGPTRTPPGPSTTTPPGPSSRTPPGPSATTPSGPSTSTPSPTETFIPLYGEGPPVTPDLGPRATGEQVYASIPDDGIYTIMITLPESPIKDVPGEEPKEQPTIKLYHNEIPSLKKPPAGMRARRQVDSKDVGTSTADDLNSILPAPPTPVARRPSILPERIPYKLPKAIRARAKKKRKTAEKKQDKKAAKTLTAILLSFIITWTPYNVLVLLKPVTTGYACIPQQLWDFFYYLCYINSTINPVCYALCNASFRRTYVRILTCKWHSRERVGVSRGGFNQ